MKLHITKTLPVAILAACMVSGAAHAAVTGWGPGSDGRDVLYVGTTENDPNAACNTNGIGEVSKDGNNNTVIASVKVSDYKSDLTSFRIAADNSNNQVATINSLEANDNSTITVANSGWTPIKKFSNLTIGNLSVNNGSIIVSDGEKLTLNGLTGTLSNVTVYGSLTLSSAVQGLNNFTLGTNATLGGIYNLGQQFSGGVTFTLLDAADDVVAGIATNGVYERTLYDATMWNAERITSGTLTIDGYENGGLVYLKDGKYYNQITKGANNALFGVGESIELDPYKAYIVANVGTYNVDKFSAVVVPEPTTATLSLLALAGLAARRRRH